MNRAVLIVTVLCLGASARGTDWPRWRGPEGTGHVPAGTVVPKSLPAEPRVLWHIPIGFGSGSPVVSDRRVFCLDNQQGKEVVLAASIADGREVWRVPLDDVYADSGSAPGPRGTPTVDGDRVYVQSCRGEFQCLQVRDGQPVWRVNFTRDFGAAPLQESGDIPGATRHGNTASPLISGDRIFVMVGGRPNASVVCFDKRTGRVIWKSQDDVPGHAGPVLATLGGVRQLVCFMAEAVIGLDERDGTLLWRFPIKTHLGRHVTTPLVVGNTVVVGSYTVGLVGIRVTGGPSGFTATQAWKDTGLGVNFSSPVAVGQHVYCIGPANRLFCVNARTGTRAWVQDGFFSGMLESGFASFIVAGPNLLILAEGGQLLLVPATPSGCKTISRTSVCGRNWCSPAYADGRLFVRDAQELRCLQLAP